MGLHGQFDIADFATLIPWQVRGSRAVLGYRKHRNDGFLRKVNAWGWNRLGRLLFGLRIRDVDCAFKLYDTNIVCACEVVAEGAMVNTLRQVRGGAGAALPPYAGFGYGRQCTRDPPRVQRAGWPPRQAQQLVGELRRRTRRVMRRQSNCRV